MDSGEAHTALVVTRLAQATAHRMVEAGLLVAVAMAIFAGTRLVLAASSEDVLRCVIAGVIATVTALTAVVSRRRVVPLLEHGDSVLMAWSALLVVCFAIDGPGDELLLPAALGPIGIAGMLGHPSRALACAAIVDVGYLSLLALQGDAAWRGAGLQTAVANASFVLLTVAIMALPVQIALITRRSAPELVQSWRLEQGPERPELGVGETRSGLLGRLLGSGAARPMIPQRTSEALAPLLSAQEWRVLLRVRAGAGYKQVALEESDILGHACSKHRVRRIVAGIKDKVGVRSLNELAALDLAEFGL